MTVTRSASVRLPFLPVWARVTWTPGRAVRAVAASAAVALTLAGCASGPAAPVPGPTVTVTAPAPTPTRMPDADRRSAMGAANLECSPITDDVRFENCVIGAYVLATGEVITDADFTYDEAGSIILA